jgi:hypothetical protein
MADETLTTTPSQNNSDHASEQANEQASEQADASIPDVPNPYVALMWELTELGENLGHLETRCCTLVKPANAMSKYQAKLVASLGEDTLTMMTHVNCDHKRVAASLDAVLEKRARSNQA